MGTIPEFVHDPSRRMRSAAFSSYNMNFVPTPVSYALCLDTSGYKVNNTIRSTP